MRKAFAKALKRAKLPGFRLYDFGHTDATTTLGWYARWLPRTDRRAVDMLDDALIDALGAAQPGTVGSQSGSEREIGELRGGSSPI